MKNTLEEVKEELETLKRGGYTLRTRYPSDYRNKSKQRWQRTLWTDFFQNQGFHRDDTDTAATPGHPHLSIRAALDRFAAASSGKVPKGCSRGWIKLLSWTSMPRSPTENLSACVTPKLKTGCEPTCTIVFTRFRYTIRNSGRSGFHS